MTANIVLEMGYARAAQGGSHCHWNGALRVHPSHQPALCAFEEGASHGSKGSSRTGPSALKLLVMLSAGLTLCALLCLLSYILIRVCRT